MRNLSARCMIDMETITKGDTRIFYHKPNSIFLEDPEIQRQYRNKLMNRATDLKEQSDPTLAD